MTVMCGPAVPGEAAAGYGWLIDHAADRTDPDTHVFACVIAARIADPRADLAGGFGLDAAAFRDLLARHFPALPGDGAALPALFQERQAAPADAIVAEEVEDLRTLLLDHAAPDRPEPRWLAGIVAAGCLGSDHLWQDLGLTSRKDLSGLLTRNFGTLAAKNTGDMKWKKFFYKQLCDREGLNLCKAPSCGVCTDYKVCFGPEE